MYIPQVLVKQTLCKYQAIIGQKATFVVLGSLRKAMEMHSFFTILGTWTDAEKMDIFHIEM